ncbi:Dynein heavy chain 2, axonemal [Bagarius yarrelli]|uniref:Dynein heavy chain 2, axonemal n=1 Tax=Bagarius yarrelli TaxID=175774 RepID=A0A556TUR6_BAGYA|nr:Dynein heavy chain 2, axonemal [Bagarius yarrelli]
MSEPETLFTSSSKSKHFGTENSLDEPELEDSDTQPAVEAQNEEAVSPVSEEEDVCTDDLRDLFKRRLALTGLSTVSWSDENNRTLDKFITDATIKLLIIYIDPSIGLRVQYAMPIQVVEQLAYFIRTEDSLISEETFESCVQFGTVRGGGIESLLRLMNGIQAPLVSRSTDWPESIKNYYISHTHRFITYLTDARFRLMRKTVLYVPMEALQHKTEVTAKDKEMVKRLEGVMIHWTRQITEVLNIQVAIDAGDRSGLLDEITFWMHRCDDLSGIRQQLQKPEVWHIQNILKLAKSSYVEPFCNLAKEIQDGFLQAQSNLSFLCLLREPCEELAQLKPRQIAHKLGHILNLIRFIWVNSPHYNIPARIIVLLIKMNNEIIRWCTKEISLERIFQGYVISSKETLNDCIFCCVSWRKGYQLTSQLHAMHSQEGWTLSESSIFSLLDGFMQRCTHLLEVCECQEQFARRAECVQLPMPCFAGHQGPEITRKLLKIEAMFNMILQNLCSESEGVFELKSTTWHESLNRFRSAVKELELMVQKLISTAFSTVKTVEHGIQLIDLFRHFSTREAIRQTLEKQTKEVCGLFAKDLELLKAKLGQKKICNPAHMPFYAGQVHWIRAMRERIDKQMEVLQHFMPDNDNEREVEETYKHLVHSMDQRVRRLFNEWSQNLDHHNLKRLDQPLMIRCAEKAGMLDIHFNKCILKMFNEIHYWKQLKFEIPHVVSAICHRKEELHTLRENVLLLVKDYNRIIAALSPETLGLFHERINFLDKQIQPGLSNLLWSSPGATSLFIGDCRIHVSKVQLMVDDYKAAHLAVCQRCSEISELLLVHLDGATVYKVQEFEQVQQEHQQKQLRCLRTAHQDIVDIMSKIYETFRRDGTKVQHHWVSYTEKIDRMVEEALRLNIKCSLQALSKEINEDSKNSPNPLFKVQVVLTPDTPETNAQLAQTVNSISSQLFKTILDFRRLPDIFTQTSLQRKPIHSIIEQDDEICKIRAAIAAGMKTNATHLQAYVKTWDKYREIWEIKKEPFIQRYKRLNPSVSTLDADIARYTEVLNNVQREETVLNVQFVLLDCSPLMFSLVDHCTEWQDKLTQLLIHMASNRLKELHSYLHDNAQRISQIPHSLDKLVESIALLDTLQRDVSKTESQIRPIQEQFAILEKYEELSDLQQVWEVTQQWEAHWNEWKSEQFTTLQTDHMEVTAQTMFKKLNKLSRDLKDKQWDIVGFSKNRIEQFKRTIPMIIDLKNPAMRQRHWDEIKFEVQRPFDQESANFTLEEIVSLGLDQHAERICEISAAASKELSIEQSLEGIIKTWEDISLDIAPYKDKGHHRLRGTEEVFQALEDNQVTLSTMKASRFVRAFEKEVDHWERCLSLILEVIEMTLTVQRQWMYLENIFLGEDIRKQLPRESAEFDDINFNWKIIMDRLNKDKNALRGTQHPGLLEKLSDMNNKLEEIQKSLDMYLETKRQIFPRFYFLSNDDLLEILGQSRNPEAVGIGSLKSEACGMFSADGEFVEFTYPVLLEGPVEAWLCDIERIMRCTLKDSLKNCCIALKKMTGKRDKWVKDWPGQMVITASQIQWTTDVTKSLIAGKERADKSALKSMKKKQVSMLHRYSDAIRGNLSKIMRLKIVALVTVEVHARDVIDKLAKTGCCDVNAFDWLCQLRLYWDKDVDDCIIRQTNTHFRYGYEYLGNSGRLVITPLTDRSCRHRQNETTKDLGKSLGMYVMLWERFDGLDYKSMGACCGLAQGHGVVSMSLTALTLTRCVSSGPNRFLSILRWSAGATNFIFEGRELRLVWSCGVLSLDPGYAGRTELPDNLKSMFRPISMVVPDSTLIAEITLFGEGFNNCKLLAKKVFTLYSLAVQQLSKQDHYDFGLRALTSLLRYAGKKRRARPDVADEEILLMSMKDMNIAKLTSIDLPLFNGIIQDLFPAVETPTIDYGKLKETIEAELRQKGLQVTPFTMTKIIQMYETKNSRHSSMIVGKSGSGKSVTWRILQSTLSTMHRKGEPGFNSVHEYPLNPKAVSLGELYGEYDLSTNEWTDGILSSLMRAACAEWTGSWDEGVKRHTWRDVSLLYLLNFFCSKASVQLNKPDLFILQQEFVVNPKAMSLEELFGHFDLSYTEWTDGTLSTIMRQTCTDEKPDEKWIVFDGPVDTLWIESMNSVMDDNKVLTLINGERISMPEQVSLLFEVEDLAVASPATVSRCGMVYNDYSDLGWQPYVQSWVAKRQKVEVDHLKRLFDKYIEKTIRFRKTHCKELVPITELNGVISLCRLYDSLASPENGLNPADTEHYGSMIELWFVFSLIWSVCASVDEDGRKKMDNFLREMEVSFPNKIMVPTVDTVRYHFLVDALICGQYPVLLTGPVGTGKTSVAQSVLQGLDSSKWAMLTINMSSQTTSNNVQAIIESRVEKRTKGVYVPIGGKKMVAFMDDLNMPAVDDFGSQPPLELLKLWIDYGFWYDRQKQTQKCIKDMFLLSSMGPPGGGRTHISGRLQSRFNLINMTFPAESQIKRIYGTMINQKLQEFDEEVKPIGDVLTQATLELYYAIIARFLPTPAKIHYLFNLRDISKVFQGLLRSHKDFYDTKQSITRLWIHECFRVFSDRLVDHVDMEAFVGLLSEKLGSLFDLTYHSICPNKQPPIFGDFLKEPRVYEDLQDFKNLKTFIESQLEDHNLTPGVVPMSLVLFRDAIEHVTRVLRVISQPRGNMLLVGIGGSGRQSLSKLATYICEYLLFQVEVTKQYRKQEFREDIKKLYRMTGVDNKPTVFLFNDTQIVDESFLEDINNILSSGEVPNLYKPDEFEEIQSALIESARKDNVNRIRQYPALVNCTTIDWFSEWPQDALLEVAERYLDGLTLGNDEGMQTKVASIFVTMHQSVVQFSQRMKLELKRHNYVTPTNYLELVSGYKKLLAEKRFELGEQVSKLRNGLFKIDETRVKVEAMSVELEDAKKKVAEFQKQCEEYLVVIVQQKREADEQQKVTDQWKTT